MTKHKSTYELFGRVLNIDEEYRFNANLHLRSWNTLHDFLTNAEYTEEDLMKHIVIEKEGKSRKQLISRMHSAITSIRRKSQQKELGIDEET